MPRLKRNVAPLLERGVESLILAIELFNRPSETARDHGVLMFLQHSFEMLLKAAILQRTGRINPLSQVYPDTYYVAPEVNAGMAFQNAYLAQAVTEESRFIPLTSCYDIADGDSHEIFYSQTHGAWQASVPKEIEPTHGADFPTLLKRAKERSRPVNRDLVRELIRTLASVGSVWSREHEAEERKTLSNMLRIAADAAMSLGLHLSIVGDKQ